jgi:hypothetical protein
MRDPQTWHLVGVVIMAGSVIAIVVLEVATRV